MIGFYEQKSNESRWEESGVIERKKQQKERMVDVNL